MDGTTKWAEVAVSYRGVTTDGEVLEQSFDLDPAEGLKLSMNREVTREKDGEDVKLVAGPTSFEIRGVLK